MPRKQRFKPSRKPQSTQTQGSTRNVDERQKIRPDRPEQEQASAERRTPRDDNDEPG